MTIECDPERYGVGVLVVSESMLFDFVTQKPSDLQIVGSAWCSKFLQNAVAFIVKGPMIPTIPGERGLAEVIAIITKLEDGSLEWCFQKHGDNEHAGYIPGRCSSCRYRSDPLCDGSFTCLAISEDSEVKSPSGLAGTGGAYGYESWMWVEDKFGCVMWEPK
jgi:hypothetical protein